MSPQDEREAHRMLADRGRFSSAGPVPFDVVVLLLTAALRQPGAEYRRGVGDAAAELDRRAENARVAAIGGGMDPMDASLLDYEYSNAAAAIRLLRESTKGEGRG